MAGRILNRRELRRQSDAAESADRAEYEENADGAEEDAEEAEEEDGAGGRSEKSGDEGARPAKVKAKPKAAAKARKPRKVKAAPRMCARWGVFDASMKQLAVFDYKDKPLAEAKVSDLAAKKNGTFFLQLVKEPMPEEPPPTSATGQA